MSHGLESPIHKPSQQTDRNFKANASSRKPNTTLITFIQPPDLGMDFNQDGNMANRVNGNASAMAKPNIPMAGAITLPVVETSTNKKPMIGLYMRMKPKIG